MNPSHDDVLPHDDVDGTETEAIEVIELSPEDSLIFAEAILNPPKPSPAMIRAAALHRKMIISE